jgi:hypothetical protein
MLKFVLALGVLAGAIKTSFVNDHMAYWPKWLTYRNHMFQNDELTHFTWQQIHAITTDILALEKEPCDKDAQRAIEEKIVLLRTPEYLMRAPKTADELMKEFQKVTRPCNQKK